MGCEGTAGTALDLLFHMASPLQHPTRQVLYVVVTDKLLQVGRNCVGVGGGAGWGAVRKAEFLILENLWCEVLN